MREYITRLTTHVSL